MLGIWSVQEMENKARADRSLLYVTFICGIIVTKTFQFLLIVNSTFVKERKSLDEISNVLSIATKILIIISSLSPAPSR